jgi:deazaflavin-dependent oxidoreductase (nitroreductase family)
MGLYAPISNRLIRIPGLTTRLSQVHGAIFKRTKGRVGKRFLGRPVLVLRTVGRKSGKERLSPMFFLEDGPSYAVVASNAGSPTTPAWLLNAEAAGGASVMLGGREVAVDVRRASAAERERLWPRLDQLYEGYESYRGYTDREIPIALLTPRSQ